MLKLHPLSPQDILSYQSTLPEIIKKQLEELISEDTYQNITEIPAIKELVIEFKSQISELANSKYTDIALCNGYIKLAENHLKDLQAKSFGNTIDSSWVNLLIKLINYCLSFIKIEPYSLKTTYSENIPINESYENKFRQLKETIIFQKSLIDDENNLENPSIAPTKN